LSQSRVATFLSIYVLCHLSLENGTDYTQRVRERTSFHRLMVNETADQVDLVELRIKTTVALKRNLGQIIVYCRMTSLFPFLLKTVLVKMSSIIMDHLIGVTMIYIQTSYFCIWTTTQDDIVRTNAYSSINKIWWCSLSHYVVYTYQDTRWKDHFLSLSSIYLHSIIKHIRCFYFLL
jgi:hypothetical protein